jgi:hypothetical protein
MSNWSYEFKGYTIQLEDDPVAAYTGEVPDAEYLISEVDAEVHRLTALIQKSEYEIYKLRKWQKVMKKNE